MKLDYESGFVPGMAVESSAGDGTVPLASLSEIAFGRDISGLHWDELKPEEKRAINELAQSSVVGGWIERLALRGVPEPKADVAPVAAPARAIWTIPAGHQNRKARRAAKAARRREAWKTLKAHPTGKENFAAFMQREIERGRRDGMSSSVLDPQPTEKK